MKSLIFVVFWSMLAVSWIIAEGAASPCLAKDALEVVRDKDKTSYVIDSDDASVRQDERDKERAWQMLQNQGVLIDGRQKQPVPKSAVK